MNRLRDDRRRPRRERHAAVAAAGARGLRLAYHHHMETVVQTMEEIESFIAHARPHTHLLLDTGHAAFAGDEMTRLEETYYFRIDPPQGFGFQRVFAEEGDLDETMAVHDGDTVLVPRGHHPCGAPYGYDMYYLTVMAGPRRRWRFRNHPDHDWIYRRDAAP